ncbi:COR domain-containing protein, partial [Roseibium sp.]|uniref:COR domain-containing protein n=1 Tax=Roseibium sp. TaxID=1936156 RepID=UPI003D0EC8B0
LTYLDCSKTRVTSLEGIEGLSRLISLECQETPLTSLEGVEGLKSLEWLDCSDTKISSFDPLLPLERLKGLVAEDCGQLSASPELWLKPSLVHVELFGTKLHGVPDEVLSEQNCIYELAAHCADLGDNPERLSDVKLMVLGNGRVGKTQLVRRLQGRAYQDNSDSTHGILVESTPLPIGHDGETVPVKIWDFGGQDIYHATHALFYRTRAIFLICWHPDFENEKTVDLDGFRSRNHELPYWLKHVQHCADRSGAVLVAQTRCDREGDGEQEPYGTLNALKGLGGYVRHDLKTSAATGLGLDALVADLKEAYAGINPPLIGPGRAQVKRLLEERLARIEQAKAVNGGDLPEVEKALRTLTVEEFKSLCEDAGQISDPDLFLKFLHDAGVVFWQEGLLHDRIVLDQNWALEAIYALFNRDHCVARLREAEGRFTAADVGTWLWDRDFSFGDQQLFLAMMKSCGICFHVHDGVYIAPEFLPEEPPHEVRQNWPGSNDFGTVVQIFEKQERVKVFHSHLSTRTLIRSIICVHGPFYGIKGAYWATGIQFVDEEFGCIGMIEYTKAVSSVFRDQDEGDSTITIRVRPVRKSVDGSLELFFERLCNGVRAEADQLGIEIW